jgi:hypothetical protein
MKSIDDLEDAISTAKKAVPSDYVVRLSEYDKVIATQRGFIVELVDALNQEEYDAVPRLVSLINGLSVMIRDDARAILRETQDKEE